MWEQLIIRTAHHIKFFIPYIVFLKVKDNLPNAEWIVAHLGMSYPDSIIPSLVDLALKQIHEQCDSFGLPLNIKLGTFVTTGLKVNFVESMSYISKFHRRQVQQRAMMPLKNALLASKTRYSNF